MTNEELINHIKYDLEIGADITLTNEDAEKIIKALEQNERWESGYKQMYQEKICELNKRKKELENQLNISVQNNIANEMIMCCEEKRNDERNSNKVT